MKFIFISILFASISSQAQNYGGGGNSCTIGARQAWCRDMHTTPSTDRLVDINGCSVNCDNKYRPVCNPGYLTGSSCSDPVEPSVCYCGG